jgi:hypothetical protein
METAASLVGLIFLAGFVEWATERLFGSFIDGWKMTLAASAIGIALAIVFKVGVITALELSGIDMTSTAAEYADFVITGIIIGAGASVAHDLITKYAPRKE